MSLSALAIAIATAFVIANIGIVDASSVATQGKIVRGKIDSIDGENVTLRTKDGKIIKVTRAQIGRKQLQGDEIITVYFPPPRKTTKR